MMALLRRLAARLSRPDLDQVAEAMAEAALCRPSVPLGPEIDHLNLIGLREDAAAYEAVIRGQHAAAATDPALAALLQAIFLDPDRAAAFARFLASRDFERSLSLIDRFGGGREAALCEIGGGPGFLAWALRHSGYAQVHLFEPNGEFITGTGYLRSRTETEITLFNDLEHWHRQGPAYATVVTKNCIHHFRNITYVAASIRQKMAPGGRWISIREWFADTPAQLYELVSAHPYCQPYGCYEWPFPAPSYVEAIELAGFRLRAVVPAGYANNCLGTWSEAPDSQAAEAATAAFDRLLDEDPAATVRGFWLEANRQRLGLPVPLDYLRPQAFVFERL